MANSKRQCACGCKDFERPSAMLRVPSGKWFINADHAASYAKSRGAKLRKRVERNERKEIVTKRKAFYANDVTKQKALTQTAANRLCALLDEGWPCISCGRPLRGGRAQHASHFKSRGASSFLRYDLRNLHLSCVVCNQHQSGNISGYRAGILSRYGDAVLLYLESAPRLKEWTCEELIAMRKELNAEIRRLGMGLPPSKDWRSIQSQEARLAGRGEQERSVA